MDGRGEFEYVANPQAIGTEPQPPQPEPQLHGTPQSRPTQQGDAASNPPVVQPIG